MADSGVQKRNCTVRMKALKKRMVLEDLDYVLILDGSHIRYLVGYTGSNGLLLVGIERAEFLTDPRYRTQVRAEVKTANVTVVSGDLLDSLPGFGFLKTGRKRIGYESHLISEQRAGKLRTVLPKALWVGFDDLLSPLMQIKDATEIAAIQKAASIADDSLLKIMPLIQPGVRERDIAAELEYQMLMGGSEAPAFETIVASGSRSALPHGRASMKRINKGDFVTLDFGATVDGYVSDITRTVVVGKPTARQKSVYNVVLRAQQSAIRKACPGVVCSELDKVARSIINRAGHGPRFEHGLGHGLGLAVHEGPAVNARSTTVLKLGMVITIEPGIYYAGWGGVRIEDDIVIGRNGSRVLTRSDRNLVVL